jgi:hypothetical protein
MPSKDNSVLKPARKRHQKPTFPGPGAGPSQVDLAEGMSSKSNRMAMTSSLDTIHIAPRTPKLSRHSPWNGTVDETEVELSLLGEEERHAAANGLDDVEDELPLKRDVSSKDKRAMVLLVVLCGCSFCRSFCLH